MTFLADMGISPATIEFLRGLGYAAEYLHEQRLDRLDGVSILAKAKAEDRILLPHDLGFGDLIAASAACRPSDTWGRVTYPETHSIALLEAPHLDAR